jgi:uncharacterized repeat protein (TIGR01451 family)
MIRLLAVLSLALAATSPPVINLPQVDPPVPALPGIGQPAGGQRLSPSFRDAVYGDFLLVGNSVLRCPKPGEDTAGGNSAQDCRAATDNSVPGGLLDDRDRNNGYVMRLADEDNDPSTFDSSAARLAVPAGATVRYAQLNWGGHTGNVVGFSGVNCARPLLFEGRQPPPPAAETPARQRVGLSINGGRTLAVPSTDTHYRAVGGLAEPSELYSNWADVTALLTKAPTGREITVSVSNVWAPSGLGCAAGWSLVVVFGYRHSTSAYPRLRTVDLYTDQLPQGGAIGGLVPAVGGMVARLPGVLPDLLPDLPLFGTTVVLPGLNQHPGAANVRLGVTAFDGDRGLTDTLTADGSPVAEPCSGTGSEDFFSGCAQGALDPLDPGRHPANDLSVDAKTMRPKLPDGRGGDIEIGVQSFADFFLLHNIVLAEDVDPGVTITNTGPSAPVRQGDLAQFTITVTNSGSLPLDDIQVADTSEPASEEIRCLPKTLPRLDPGESHLVTCVQPADGVAFTNTATVTATFLTPTGGPPRTVSASAGAKVDVVTPDISIRRMPDQLVVHRGEPVTFHVTVFNNSRQTALHDVVYTDPATDCGRRQLADLPPRSQLTFSCVANPDKTFTSSATLEATDDNGLSIAPVTSQQITVVAVEPALEITVAVDKSTIYRGDTVTLTFTVTNRGKDPTEVLTDLRVTVPVLPGCVPVPIKQLAAGQTGTTTCAAAPERTTDVVADATGTDITGAPVSARSEPVPITVLDPPLSVTQRVDRSTIRTGGQVTITFTVTNTGDDSVGPVTNVTVTDPAVPDCRLAPVDQLDPGVSASRDCTVRLDRTVDSVAKAGATDSAGRPMTAVSAPLTIKVINPMLTISTTADPTQAKQGAAVQFTVTVRNIGDVALDVVVHNDKAPPCDFDVPGDGLPPKAAQGRQCITHTPPGLTPFTNTARFTAQPPSTIADPGAPITGEAGATVEIVPGQAAPDPTPAGANGSSNSGSSNGGTGSATGGGGTRGNSGASSGAHDSGGLAFTGTAILVPLMIAGGLLTLGLLLTAAARRRRDGEPGFLDRWWPGN